MRTALIYSAVLVFVSGTALAHHSQSAYTSAKTITVKTTITQFEWINPHCNIYFSAPDDNGKIQHWTLEMPPPSVQVKKGWSRKSLKPGDVVTVVFHPAENGSNGGTLVKVVLANGQELVNRP